MYSLLLTLLMWRSTFFVMYYVYAVVMTGQRDCTTYWRHDVIGIYIRQLPHARVVIFSDATGKISRHNPVHSRNPAGCKFSPLTTRFIAIMVTPPLVLPNVRHEPEIPAGLRLFYVVVYLPNIDSRSGRMAADRSTPFEGSLYQTEREKSARIHQYLVSDGKANGCLSRKHVYETGIWQRGSNRNWSV